MKAAVLCIEAPGELNTIRVNTLPGDARQKMILDAFERLSAGSREVVTDIEARVRRGELAHLRLMSTRPLLPRPDENVPDENVPYAA